MAAFTSDKIAGIMWDLEIHIHDIKEDLTIKKCLMALKYYYAIEDEDMITIDENSPIIRDLLDLIGNEFHNYGKDDQAGFPFVVELSDGIVSKHMLQEFCYDPECDIP